MYIYKNPKEDLQPFHIIDLETTEFQFQNGSYKIIALDKGQKIYKEIELDYEKFEVFEKWKGIIINKLDAIKERRKYFEGFIVDEDRKSLLS